jgi:hypothetical protein
MRRIHALFIVALAGPATAQVPGLAGTIIVTNKTPSTATIVDVASGRSRSRRTAGSRS